jgi:hypothetical protein
MTNLTKLIVVIIFILLVVLGIKFILPRWIENKLNKNIDALSEIKSKPIIEIKDYDGFLIHIPNGKTVLTTKWTEISKVELSMKDSVLVMFKVNSTNQKLKFNDYNFEDVVCLIKAIPQNVVVNKEFIAFRDNYFAHLYCCEICGKLAVKDSNCLSCANDTYEKYYNDFSEIFKNGGGKFEEKNEYIKSQQLFWFTTFIKNGKVDFKYKDIIFDNCKDWKPLISDEEVIEYEKEDNE